MALVPLSVVQAWTGSYPELTKDRPTDTLFYGPVLLSVVSASLIQLGFLLYFFLDVQRRDFYVPNDPTETAFAEPDPSYESTVLFMVANFQYLATCIAFSVAKPFRKPIWSNIPFTVCTICLNILGSLCVLLPNGNVLAQTFELLPYQKPEESSEFNYRVSIMTGIIVNSLMTITVERLITGYITAYVDKRKELRKNKEFHEKMETYNQDMLREDYYFK